MLRLTVLLVHTELMYRCIISHQGNIRLHYSMLENQDMFRISVVQHEARCAQAYNFTLDDTGDSTLHCAYANADARGVNGP